MNLRQTRALNTSIVLILGFIAGCAGEESAPIPGTGGNAPTGGVLGSGGTPGAGGSTTGAGGAPAATGGSTSGGAVTSAGGVASGGITGGAMSTGGSGLGSGGTAKGGSTGSAGGSKSGTGGNTSTTGGTAAGGAGAGGATKSTGCGVTDYPMSGKAMIDVAGTQREYILKLPSNYDTNTAYKLVFGWHWRGGTAENVASGAIGGGAYYGLEKQANGTAIFVSPNGIDNGWANTGGRDMAFLKAMLAFFNSKLCIDQTRIFSTGFSFGGMMSDAIGLDMADVFRAIAPMSGAIYSGGNRSSTKPIAVWMSHGDADDVVPIADGEAALKIFLKNNGCGTQTAAVTPSPCVAYDGCTAGYPVHYCKFSGGHMSPSFASQAIWQFFSQF
jgi:polyhydroxybutyrate depolymerase